MKKGGDIIVFKEYLLWFIAYYLNNIIMFHKVYKVHLLLKKSYYYELVWILVGLNFFKLKDPKKL